MPDEKQSSATMNRGATLLPMGALWAFGGVLGYAAANVFDRFATINADPFIGPMVRSFPSLLLGVVLLITRKTYRQLQPGSPAYVGRRAILAFVLPGVLSTIGLFVYYDALQLGGVAITIAVQQTFVLWGALFSWAYLGEALSPKSLMSVIILVAGLVVMVLGQMRGVAVSAHWYYAIPLALFTAVAYGISGVFWREGQLRGADQSTGIFVQFVVTELFAFFALLCLGRAQALLHMSASQLGALLASGVLSGIVGIYCLFTALKLMKVARAYALFSLTPLVAAILAHFFLSEFINLQMLAGILLTCVGLALVQIFLSAKPEQPSEK